MTLLGGHPVETRTIAVSNGNVSGIPLKPSAQNRNGNHMMLAAVREKKIGQDKVVLEMSFYDDAVTTSKSSCRMEVLGDVDNCPSFKMPSQLANVTSAPGSYINAMQQIDDTFDEIPDTDLATIDATIEFVIGGLYQAFFNYGLSNLIGHDIIYKGNLQNPESHTTFVPTLSAFDIASTNWFSPASTLTNLSPFDALYGNATDNHPHSQTSTAIRLAITSELATTEETRRDAKKAQDRAIAAII